MLTSPPPPITGCHLNLTHRVGGREILQKRSATPFIHPQSSQQQRSCGQSGNHQLSVLYRMIRLCGTYTRRVLVSLMNATSTKLALSTPMYICTRFISADQNLHSMYVH